MTIATVDRFLALIALLVVGSWGWGRAAVAALCRSGWRAAPAVLNAPLQIVLGVALFICASGYLVAAGLASFDVLLAWHLVGLAVVVVNGVRWLRRTHGVALRSVVAGVLCAAVGVVLLLIGLAQAMRPGQYNVNDDDGAYLYLAKRLLATGGTIDPFNQRRVTSFGGNTPYHAMFLHVAGNSSVRGFEFVFGALVLALAAVRTARRRWLVPGALVVGVGAVMGHGTGPVVNLSPAFSVAALSLGAYQVLGSTRMSRDPDDPRLFAVVGVLAAAVLALRFTFDIAVVSAVVLVLVGLYGRRSLRPLVVVAAGGLAGILGWAVAELRSSGTPLFPLVKGNFGPTWPAGTDPSFTGFSRYAHLFRASFDYSDTGMVALLSAVVGLALFYLWRRDPVRSLVLAAAGIGCLIELVAFVYMFSGSDPGDIARFEGPSTLACGLLAVDTLWPLVPARGTHVRSRSAVADLRETSTRIVAVVMAVLIGSLTVGYTTSTLRAWFDVSRSNVAAGYRIVEHSKGFIDRYATFRSSYHRLNKLVPPGAKVLAAVPFPGLLDFGRYDFATLDLPGGASPPPSMPFFEGAAAKVAYLRRLGYQYIVTAEPQVSGLYQLRPWLNDYRIQIYAYRAWTPFVVDWQSTVNELEQDKRFAVRYAGPLALIPIA